MESKPLESFPTARPRGKPYANQLKVELLAYVEAQESRRDFPLVFYWAVVNAFRERTHSTRRIRKYLDQLVGEGALYVNSAVWEDNPLISTKPFREEP